jgi:hypothetical protein
MDEQGRYNRKNDQSPLKGLVEELKIISRQNVENSKEFLERLEKTNNQHKEEFYAYAKEVMREEFAAHKLSCSRYDSDIEQLRKNDDLHDKNEKIIFRKIDDIEKGLSLAKRTFVFYVEHKWGIAAVAMCLILIILYFIK